MSIKRGPRLMAVLGALVALQGVACGGNGGRSGPAGSFQGTGLTGAGATFPDPIYEKWFRDFRLVETGAKINYQPIGSGGGVTQFTSKTVDFGATDAPLKSEEESALPAPAMQVPTVLGGVVIAYNVQGLRSGLKLDGKVAADIFLGGVKTWNDPEIAALNSGVTLPGTPVQIVHRSDESGTTKVFTSWLSAESPQWEQTVGADKAVQWPAGTGANGNDGVSAGIAQTDGAIGYLSYDFAVNANLGMADLKRDGDGQFVKPSVQAISAAGAGLRFPITQETNILNSDAPGAYPISTTTYLLVFKDLTPLGKDRAQTLVDFLHWALTRGQGEVSSLNYSPLPQTIAQEGLQQVDGLLFQGKAMQPTPGVTG